MKEFDGPISFSQPPGIIFQADMDMLAAQQAQDLQAIKDQAERTQRRLAKYREWVTPEAIAARVLKAQEEAAAALEKGKLMGRDLEDIPIPDPLPKEMQGQSLSTIRSMLRHRKDWQPELKLVEPQRESRLRVRIKD